MRVTENDLIPYLDHLRDLPFVRDVEVEAQGPGAPAMPQVDAVLRLQTPLAQHEFVVELKKTHLNRAVVDGVLARMGQLNNRPWILFAPYVGRPIGQYLTEHNANYVDEAGNCRLQIGQEHIAIIQGKRRKPVKRGRGVGVAGYRVLFALLARQDLLNTPVRTLAAAAGVSKNAAAHAIARLIEDGIVGEELEQRRLLDRRALLDRWLAGYTSAVRPRLLVGTFRTPDEDPMELERRIEAVLGMHERWVWGGGAAAMRLTQFYRGPDTVLHVATWHPEYAKRLQALRAQDGPLVVLRTPGEIALEGALPRTAHPLLVYTELLATGKPRAREAAAEIQRSYLAQ
jgi:hypothetical protein